MQAFDSLLAGPVAEYLKISKEIGGDVQKHVRMFCPFFPLLRTGDYFQILLLGLRAPLEAPGSIIEELTPCTGTIPQNFPGPLLLSHFLHGLLLY